MCLVVIHCSVCSDPILPDEDTLLYFDGEKYHSEREEGLTPTTFCPRCLPDDIQKAEHWTVTYHRKHYPYK